MDACAMHPRKKVATSLSMPWLMQLVRVPKNGQAGRAKAVYPGE
jgi:hypothetical protein